MRAKGTHFYSVSMLENILSKSTYWGTHFSTRELTRFISGQWYIYIICEDAKVNLKTIQFSYLCYLIIRWSNFTFNYRPHTPKRPFILLFCNYQVINTCFMLWRLQQVVEVVVCVLQKSVMSSWSTCRYSVTFNHIVYILLSKLINVSRIFFWAFTCLHSSCSSRVFFYSKPISTFQLSNFTLIFGSMPLLHVFSKLVISIY